MKEVKVGGRRYFITRGRGWDQLGEGESGSMLR